MEVGLEQGLEFNKVECKQSNGELFASIYHELLKIARRHLNHSRFMCSINATLLVNESYLRLCVPSVKKIESKAHLMNLVSLTMRQIICDYARKVMNTKIDYFGDDSSEDSVNLTETDLNHAQQCIFIEDLMEDLYRVDPRYAKVIECRFFAGMNEAETALAMQVSIRSVQRFWSDARQWLTEYVNK